jgi:hypothetical protein
VAAVAVVTAVAVAATKQAPGSLPTKRAFTALFVFLGFPVTWLARPTSKQAVKYRIR